MPPLRTQRTQLQQLIVTLYGLYGESTGSLRVSTLVAMLAALGIDQQAARSTISRLKSKGILLSQKDDGVARYALSSDILDIFIGYDQRISLRGSFGFLHEYRMLGVGSMTRVAIGRCFRPQIS